MVLIWSSLIFLATNTAPTSLQFSFADPSVNINKYIFSALYCCPVYFDSSHNLHFRFRNNEPSFYSRYPRSSHLWKLLDHDQFSWRASFSQFSFIRLFSVFAAFLFLQVFWCILLNIVALLLLKLTFIINLLVQCFLRILIVYFQVRSSTNPSSENCSQSLISMSL